MLSAHFSRVEICILDISVGLQTDLSLACVIVALVFYVRFHYSHSHICVAINGINFRLSMLWSPVVLW